MSVWTPLESNPDVLTKYIHKMGVPEKWAITDVLGLDAEMLDMIPKPVKSLILLFPITEKYEKLRVEENEKLKSNPPNYPEGLFYMRQVTHNACGAVAIIHSVANNPDINLNDGVLKDFITNSKELTPEERGNALENDAKFSADHQAMAEEGQTTADPNLVFHHFIALVNNNNILYELDGRKEYPIAHGPTSDESFVADAAKVCIQFMARDPDELRFTVLSFGAAQADE